MKQAIKPLQTRPEQHIKISESPISVALRQEK
jgi:hypothetical protein